MTIKLQQSQVWKLGDAFLRIVRVERLAVIDRLILRLAAWELQHEPETPPAVVLNEALELARQYSTVDAVRFVNGVLDSIRRGIAGPDSPVT